MKVPKGKPFITFQGEGMDVTKITWNDTATSSHSTFKSATVTVMALGFVARNIAFEVLILQPMNIFDKHLFPKVEGLGILHFYT